MELAETGRLHLNIPGRRGALGSDLLGAVPLTGQIFLTPGFAFGRLGIQFR